MNRPLGQESAMCVVVVNFASSDLIRAELAVPEFRSAEVVVVDNFSTKQERLAIRALTTERGWTLVEQSDNRGFGAGVNAGVARGLECGHCCFLLLNPDVRVSGVAVAALREAVLDDPMTLASPVLVDENGRVAFAGSTLDLADGKIRGRASFVAEPPPQTFRWLTAACLAVHKDLWQSVGGFDESYFMYWEDVDFGYRCWQAGANLVLLEERQAVHHQGGTQGPRRGQAKSSLYYYFNIRNRMRFAAHHLSRRDVGRWLLHTPRQSWEIFLRGGRRQIFESPAALLAAFRGFLAALAQGLSALAVGTQVGGSTKRAARIRRPHADD